MTPQTSTVSAREPANQHGSARASNPRLYRVNLMLGDDDSAWLDQLAGEIRAATGADVSRSEIVRAAIAGLRELHHLTESDGASWLPPLTRAKRGSDLSMLAVLAARSAAGSK